MVIDPHVIVVLVVGVFDVTSFRFPVQKGYIGGEEPQPNCLLSLFDNDNNLNNTRHWIVVEDAARKTPLVPRPL